MRKLILETQLSLDGFIASPGGQTNWMLWNWQPEWKWDTDLQQHHNDLIKSIDCILLSRQMAEEGFIAHWQNMAAMADNLQAEFARNISNTHKIVFSSTLNKSTPIPGGWDNAEIAKGNYIDFINQLKQQDGRDIIVYGGASFARSLIKAGLIDEFQLLINPVIIGNGLPIFNELESRQNLELVEAKGFSSGMVLLHYRQIS